MVNIASLNTADFLNQVAYPGSFDNARRKDFPLYDEVTLATGDEQKYFFQSSTGNQFARNIKFPLAGSQIFFVTCIEMNLEKQIDTAALFANVNELMQRGNLEVVVNDRVQTIIPLFEVLNFPYALTIGDDTQPYANNIRKAARKLVKPIIMNSLNNVQYRINCQSIPAAFNSVVLGITLKGIMFDKLAPYQVDYIKNNAFQDIDFTFYDSQLISTGNAATYNLFASPTQDKRALSKVLPMSGIERAEIYSMKIYLPGTDADTDFLNLLWINRKENILTITVDEVIYFQNNISDMINLGAVRGSTFDDSGGTVTTDYVNMVFFEQVLQLNTSIVFPANGNVVVTLQQPGSSIPAATNYITTMFDAIIKRRIT